jgi:hypothetical protein
MEITDDTVSVEVTFRGDAADAIRQAADELGETYARAVEVLALQAVNSVV